MQTGDENSQGFHIMASRFGAVMFDADQSKSLGIPTGSEKIKTILGVYVCVLFQGLM